MKRQKGKGNKRKKSWHRGRGESRRFAKTMRQLPDVGSGADPTTGAPIPLRKDSGPSRLHGDSL